jgi:DNA-binding GntR family transcriptional regulator
MANENFEEFAYTAILELILGNRFKPGDFLLETELARDLELSRTPVRHALGQLVAEGFLEKRKKKGCYIPDVSAEDARQIFHLRETIEGLAAASAARFATDANIAFLHTLIEKEQNPDRTLSKMDVLEINKAFHLGIAQFSGNRYLEHYCRHIFWRSNVYVFFYDRYYQEHIDYSELKTPEQHARVVAALENRNDEKAGNLMKFHIRSTYELLFMQLKHLEKRKNPAPDGLKKIKPGA